MKQNKFVHHCVLGILLLTLAGSCKKLIEIPPPANQLSTAVLFNDATAAATITGIYSQMMNNGSLFTSGVTTLYAGLAADELTHYSLGSREAFLLNELTVSNHSLLLSAFWQPAYNYIFAANACMEGLERSTQLTPDLKARLMGEARFIRAFCYFYLSNLFGDVPLVTSMDYKTNASLGRTPKALVYDQIILDLQEAVELLPESYHSTLRIRPNKWAAATLLARAYLYNAQWAAAAALATAVINSGNYGLEADPKNSFLAQSKEAIWQLYPVNPINNTWEANQMLPPTPQANPTFLLTSQLLEAFEAGDRRKDSWVGSHTLGGQVYHYPQKYKVYGNGAPLTEHYMVFRLAELYLIRAEALAQQGRLEEATTDLELLRSRAGLEPLPALDQESLLLAIEQERRVELAFEWGHRWMDLNRSGRSDAVLGSLKPTWQSTDRLWPIPQSEININPALTQNPGY